MRNTKNVSFNGHHIGCLIFNAALGAVGKHCQRHIDKWLAKNGPEWTTARLKTLWNIALHLRRGDKGLAVKQCQSLSISFDKLTGIPKGPFGTVIRNFAFTNNFMVLKRAAVGLRSYTLLRLNEPSRAQIAKGRRTIETPCLGTVPNFMLNAFFDYGKALRCKVKDLQECKKGLVAMGHQVKATSYYYYNPEMFQVSRKERREPYSYFFMSKYSSFYCPTSLEHCTAEQPFREANRRYFLENNMFPEKYVGRVAILQEAGCKARIVCMPNIWTQLAFRPLHSILEGVLKEHPASCMHDQEYGAKLILEHQANGGETVSVDLSAATDRFPLQVQTQLLRGLDLEIYAQALEEFVEQPLIYDGDGEAIRYKTGQPMGLYGSFPLFHLSNITLASLAEDMVSASEVPITPFEQSGTTFVVLGDDIVFSDSIVAGFYKYLLELMGVEVSKEKSFEDGIAEFAGFIMTKVGDNFRAFRPYKYPPSRNVINNPLQVLEALGNRASKLGQKAQEKRFWKKASEAYSKTSSLRSLDLSPLTLLDVEDDSQTANYYGDTRQIAARGAAIFYANKVEIPNEEKYFTFLYEFGGENIYSTKGIPIFKKRDMTRIYGYRRDKLIQQEKEQVFQFSAVKSSLSKDPIFARQIYLSDRLLQGDEISEEEAEMLENTNIPLRKLQRVEKRAAKKGFFHKLFSSSGPSFEELEIFSYVLDTKKLDTRDKRLPKFFSNAIRRRLRDSSSKERLLYSQFKKTIFDTFEVNILERFNKYRKEDVRVSDYLNLKEFVPDSKMTFYDSLTFNKRRYAWTEDYDQQIRKCAFLLKEEREYFLKNRCYPCNEQRSHVDNTRKAKQETASASHSLAL